MLLVNANQCKLYKACLSHFNTNYWLISHTALCLDFAVSAYFRKIIRAKLVKPNSYSMIPSLVCPIKWEIIQSSTWDISISVVYCFDNFFMWNWIIQQGPKEVAKLQVEFGRVKFGRDKICTRSITCRLNLDHFYLWIKNVQTYSLACLEFLKKYWKKITYGRHPFSRQPESEKLF